MNTVQTENSNPPMDPPVANPLSNDVPISRPISLSDFHSETYESIDLEENIIAEPITLAEQYDKILIKIFIMALLSGSIITAFYIFF